MPMAPNNAPTPSGAPSRIPRLPKPRDEWPFAACMIGPPDIQVPVPTTEIQTASYLPAPHVSAKPPPTNAADAKSAIRIGAPYQIRSASLVRKPGCGFNPLPAARGNPPVSPFSVAPVRCPADSLCEALELLLGSLPNSAATGVATHIVASNDAPRQMERPTHRPTS